MGNAEIQDALYKTASRTQSSSSTQVVVFTDGEVWGVDSVVDYVKTAKLKYGDTLRFSALGIGDEVSHELIEGIGRYGGGFAEVVAVDSPDQWDDRVLRMLNGVFTSSDWKIKLGIKDEDGTTHSSTGFLIRKHRPLDQTGSIIQLPHLLPVQHGLSRMILYFLVDSSGERYKSVCVEGFTSDDKEFKAEIPISHTAVSEPICHQLAARALLNDLEMEYSWLQDPRLKPMIKNPKTLQREIDLEAEHVAMKWGLASKWTSFVGVGEQLSTELPSSIHRFGYSRREVNELMKPRSGDMPSSDEIRKMEKEHRKRLQDPDNGRSQPEYRRRDDSDDKDGFGGSGGGPGLGSGGSSRGQSRGGTGTGSHSQRNTSKTTSGHFAENDGPSDSLEMNIDVELLATQQDIDGALCSTELSSPDSEHIFRMILRCFNVDVAEALEWLPVGVSCPAKEKTRACRTILCVVYLRRAVLQTSNKDPITDRVLQRAERWLGKIIKKRSDRRKVEQEAVKHWNAGMKLNMKDSLGENLINPKSDVSKLLRIALYQ
jgi:hypothetical protein